MILYTIFSVSNLLFF